MMTVSLVAATSVVASCADPRMPHELNSAYQEDTWAASAAQFNINDMSLMRAVFANPGWERVMRPVNRPKKPK